MIRNEGNCAYLPYSRYFTATGNIFFNQMPSKPMIPLINMMWQFH
jgi:hypothetical protein